VCKNRCFLSKGIHFFIYPFSQTELCLTLFPPGSEQHIITQPDKHLLFDFNYSAIYYNKTHITISWIPLNIEDQTVSYYLIKTKIFIQLEKINMGNATSITMARRDLKADNETDYKVYIEALANGLGYVTKTSLEVPQEGRKVTYYCILL